MRALTSSACFVVMAVLVGVAHRLDPHLSTFVSSGVRGLVGFVLVVVFARGSLARVWGDGRWELWMRGVLGSIALITYFAALQRVGVGAAAFLNQTSAIWVGVLAPFLLGEPTGVATAVAIALSTVGVAALAHPSVVATDVFGWGIGLLSGLAAAGAYLAVRRASATNTPVTVVFYFSLVTMVFSLVGWLVSGAALPSDPKVIVSLVGAGVAAALGQYQLTTAHQRAPAALVSAASAATPLLNAVAGWLLFTQIPDALGVLGMAILLATSVALPFITPKSDET